MLLLRSSALADTHAIAAAIAGAVAAGRHDRAVRRDGRRQDRVRPGLRPRARGRPSRSRRRRTRSCTATTSEVGPSARDPAPRRPLPARPHRRGRRPGARRARRVRRHRAGRVGRRGRGDASAITSSSTSNTTTPTTTTGDDAIDVTSQRRGRGRSRSPAVGATLGVALGADRRPPSSECPMLILGIETATEQVSVAIGGHEGVIGLFESTTRPASRRDARAGDRVRLPPGRHRPRRDRRGRGRRRARAVHRDARRAGVGQGDRPGAADPDDRHLVARPAGLPVPPHRSRRRRR